MDEDPNATQDLLMSPLIESQNTTIRVKRGWTNDHYETVKIGSEKKKLCRARNCEQTYSMSTSTNTLRNHWTKSHGMDQNVVKTQYILSDNEDCEAILKYALFNHSSFRSFDDPNFRKMFSKLAALDNIPTRQTVSEIFLRKTSELEPIIAARLSNCLSISLTFDIWSHKKATTSYGCVTAHYIKESILNTIILEFKEIPYPHTSDKLREFLYEMIKRFNIQSKLISITTDNATNNIAAIEELKYDQDLKLYQNFGLGFSHIRCFAHCLNLTCKAGLSEFSNELKLIRQFIGAVNGSAITSKLFEDVQLKLIEQKPEIFLIKKPLKLVQDVDTRWNSVYLMLERFIRLKPAIDESINEILGDVMFHWDRLKELYQFLKPYYFYTLKVSGENYITVSLVDKIVSNLKKHASRSYTTENLNKAAKKFLDYLNKYTFVSKEDPIILATCLDPRVKMSHYDEETKTYAEDLLRRLYRDSVDSYEANSSKDLNDDEFEADIFERQPSSEIDRYLLSTNEHHHSCPIDYWSRNCKIYPTLSKLAMIVLNIQATSTPSERAFSESGLIHRKGRTTLSPRSLRAQMILRSWVRSVDNGMNNKQD